MSTEFNYWPQTHTFSAPYIFVKSCFRSMQENYFVLNFRVKLEMRKMVAMITPFAAEEKGKKTWM